MQALGEFRLPTHWDTPARSETPRWPKSRQGVDVYRAARPFLCKAPQGQRLAVWADRKAVDRLACPNRKPRTLPMQLVRALPVAGLGTIS